MQLFSSYKKYKFELGALRQENTRNNCLGLLSHEVLYDVKSTFIE